eukprot:NODE_20445_length_798_cov_3.839046.p1 GENE.NODE_20445_length_798_cov_3.839046~~NODE_20445_length_798_cov_3.839046.p1  ORF type:complete len:232 (-),score=24.77 NODE_20445_length_798_cov_3.839046:27-722(-)
MGCGGVMSSLLPAFAQHAATPRARPAKAATASASHPSTLVRPKAADAVEAAKGAELAEAVEGTQAAGDANGQCLLQQLYLIHIELDGDAAGERHSDFEAKLEHVSEGTNSSSSIGVEPALCVEVLRADDGDRFELLLRPGRQHEQLSEKIGEAWGILVEYQRLFMDGGLLDNCAHLASLVPANMATLVVTLESSFGEELGCKVLCQPPPPACKIIIRTLMMSISMMILLQR